MNVPQIKIKPSDVNKSKLLRASPESASVYQSMYLSVARNAYIGLHALLPKTKQLTATIHTIISFSKNPSLNSTDDAKRDSIKGFSQLIFFSWSVCVCVDSTVWRCSVVFVEPANFMLKSFDIAIYRI